ncbi:hypothetical protein K525DRAFT_246595, partial [Schizophyllum commune Loenen D]
GGVDIAELRLSGHDKVKCRHAGLTQSSIVHHAVLIAALHLKLQQQPLKLGAEANTVDASSPPGKRPFVQRGWGGVGGFSPVITRLVDIEKRAISALGGLRG